MTFSVECYEKDDGTRPAEEFILSQDVKMRARLFMILEFLEKMGPQLRDHNQSPLVTAYLRSVPGRAQISAESFISSL